MLLVQDLLFHQVLFQGLDVGLVDHDGLEVVGHGGLVVVGACGGLLVPEVCLGVVAVREEEVRDELDLDLAADVEDEDDEDDEEKEGEDEHHRERGDLEEGEVPFKFFSSISV